MRKTQSILFRIVVGMIFILVIAVGLATYFSTLSRDSGLITLGGYFSVIALLVFMWIFFLVRRTIIVPVLKIGDVVKLAATGNLDVAVNIKSSDEVGDLGNQVNTMIAELKKQRSLELHNKMIETRLEENRKYLNNIKEGLLLIDRNKKISGQYSVYLTKLFKRRDIAGFSLDDFLYPDAKEFAEERKELNTFIEMLFTNTTADMEMLMRINPLSEATLEIAPDEEIIVRADFLKIFTDGVLENIMVIFEDLTDIVHTRHELDEQRLQRESELEQIATVLKVGPQVFEKFMDEASTAFQDLRSNLTNLGDEDFIAQAFRNIHSVKGTSRYLDFFKVEKYAHTLEEVLSDIRKGETSLGASSESLVMDILDQLDEELASAHKIIDKFREFSISRSEGAPSPFTVFCERLDTMVSDISKDLEKEASFVLETDLDDVPQMSELQPSLLHLIRNALDHGIEDTFERLTAGKDAEARITLRIVEDDEWLRVEVEDDGRGLDLKALERKGMESGLLRSEVNTPSEIVSMLFHPGFTNSDEVTEISGRGVGLDAVKQHVQSLNGRINVRSAVNKGTTFILTIPNTELI